MELADVKNWYLARPEDEVVRLMRGAVAAIRPGEPRLVTESWLGDTARFWAKVPTVIFGPGGPPVYCPDEYLPIADIHEATRAYAVFAALALTASEPTGRGVAWIEEGATKERATREGGASTAPRRRAGSTEEAR